MSEYKWSDPDSCDTFCYVKKGEEKLGFFQTYLELEALERQMAIAREELGKEIKKAQDFEDAYNHTYDLKCYWESMYNKLKEQG